MFLHSPPFVQSGKDFTSSHIQTTRGITARPNVLKQKNAFAPNFIHSLDSSHMKLTALHCQRSDISFVSVHDCFWTHPSTVDAMNKICREQFVALHSEPILKDLSVFFLREYQEQLNAMREKNPEMHAKIVKILTSVPETGSFELAKVNQSTYFFS